MVEELGAPLASPQACTYLKNDPLLMCCILTCKVTLAPTIFCDLHMLRFMIVFIYAL